MSHIEVVGDGKLTPQLVDDLIERRLLALRVPGFLTLGECSRLVGAVMDAPEFRFTGRGFVGLGPGAFALPAQMDDYLATSETVSAILHDPLERLRALLPLTLPTFQGMQMRPLTARRYDDQFLARPHQDHDGTKFVWCQKSQIGITLSFRTPERGGSLRLWDRSYGNTEYQQLALAGGFELDEAKLPRPDFTFDPDVGELVLIDAHRIHAIDGITAGERYSVSGFLARHAEGFHIWS